MQFEPPWTDSIHASMIRRLKQHPIRDELNALVSVDSASEDIHNDVAKVARELLDFHSVKRIINLTADDQYAYVTRREGHNLECLVALAHHAVDHVRVAIALRYQPHGDVLTILSEDPTLEVRLAVAENLGTPIGALIQLWTSDGPSGEIAEAISLNRQTSAQLLDRIVDESTDIDVLSGAARHQELSASSQLVLYERDDLNISLASNPQCLPELLTLLAQDENEFVRRSVACHPFTPTSALVHLVKDSDVKVRYALASREFPTPKDAIPLPDECYKVLENDPDLGVREKLLKKHRRRWSTDEYDLLLKELKQLKRQLSVYGHPDFPGSNAPRKPRHINTVLQRNLCESDAPLSQETLEEMLNEHALFLKTGGGGGSWAHTSVADLPLSTYLGRKCSSGKQFLLRNQQINRGADLSERDLRYANLTGACCEDIDLSGARLEGSSITDGFWAGTDFTGADLRGVDFSGSDLRGACFSGANLRGADFEQANCTGADFTLALLDNSRWPGAILDDIIRSS